MTLVRTSTLECHRLLTIDEYDRAWAAGVYRSDERLELIEGEVYCKMSLQESGHSTGIRAGEEALRTVFGVGYDVRVQLPIEIGSFSKPEPDIAVVTGTFRDYANRHPQSAILVVEVADTTLGFDRTTKAALYAQAGINEYWIVNLRDRLVEVYRQPSPATTMASSHEYVSVEQYTEGEAVSPLAAPGSNIKVSDLLP